MKFDKTAFDLVMNAPQYDGALTYLIDDDKNKVPYHIYMCIVESGNLACIITKKAPVESNDYELFEFNGNNLLEHNIVRIKPLDKNTVKAKSFISRFENKEFKFAN